MRFTSRNALLHSRRYIVAPLPVPCDFARLHPGDRVRYTPFPLPALNTRRSTAVGKLGVLVPLPQGRSYFRKLIKCKVPAHGGSV